jgi:hypothetical protein
MYSTAPCNLYAMSMPILEALFLTTLGMVFPNWDALFSGEMCRNFAKTNPIFFILVANSVLLQKCLPRQLPIQMIVFRERARWFRFSTYGREGQTFDKQILLTLGTQHLLREN